MHTDSLTWRTPLPCNAPQKKHIEYMDILVLKVNNCPIWAQSHFGTCHEPQFSHVNCNVWLWPTSDWQTSILKRQGNWFTAILLKSQIFNLFWEQDICLVTHLMSAEVQCYLLTALGLASIGLPATLQSSSESSFPALHSFPLPQSYVLISGLNISQSIQCCHSWQAHSTQDSL